MEDSAILLNKNQKDIIDALLSNQDILKCLYCTDSNTDFTKLNDLTISQKMLVRKNNIYEHRTIPDANFNEQKIYISMEYGEIAYSDRFTDNPTFATPDFVFYIVSHIDLDITKYNGTRVNFLEQCIAETFHRKKVIDALGISEIDFSSPILIGSPNYVGRQITVKFVNKKTFSPWGGGYGR